MCNCSTSPCGCETIKLQRGARGLPGVPGTPATVTAGTAIGLAYGAQPTVSNSGTTQNAVFNFGIPEGAPGTPGTNGQNAYTTLTQSFAVPINNGFGNVTIDVVNNDWAEPGQIIFIEGAGYYRVLVKIGTTQLSVNNLQSIAIPGSYPTNAAPSTVISSGNGVCPGGLQGPNGLNTLVLSGNGNPNTIPLPNPGGQNAIYLDDGGNWWTWNGSTNGPWVDTGIPATGPPGPPGLPGHTPVLTVSTGPPVGGVDGDWHIQQKNPGQWQVWSNVNGVWTQQPSGTLIANRFLGSGAVDPNLLNPALDANVGDLYFTQIGTQASFWQYNGSLWTVVVTWSTAGGGGGSDTLTTAAQNSSFVLNGQDMGNQTWMMRRTIQAIPQSVTITTSSTVTLNTDISCYIITTTGTGITLTLDYATVPNGSQRFPIPMTIEIVGPGTGFSSIAYSANKWTKNPGITHPVLVNAGERLSMRCEYLDGRLNIISVSQNYTII